MKRILNTALLLLLSSSAFGACPSVLTGLYSGHTQVLGERDVYMLITASFDKANTMNLIRTIGVTTYDGNGAVNEYNQTTYKYSFNKATCTLQAWRISDGSTSHDLFFNVVSNGTQLDGVQLHFFNNAINTIQLTKQ